MMTGNCVWVKRIRGQGGATLCLEIKWAKLTITWLLIYTIEKKGDKIRTLIKSSLLTMVM